MAELPKTLPDDVYAVLDSLDDHRKRGCTTLLAAMQHATGMPPARWSGRIIGFGSYRYRYESGREGESCALGFSPRAKEFALYLTPPHDGGYAAWADLLTPLGKVRTGKGCLYLKDPAAVDRDALAGLLRASLKALAASPVVVTLSVRNEA